MRMGVMDMCLIGMFSKINKGTVKTLRYYDEVDLLKPAYVDQENGYRYYTSEQFPQLHKILALRQSGLSIDEILSALNGHNVVEILKGKKAEIEAIRPLAMRILI